jgi:hypothetical protein
VGYYDAGAGVQKVLTGNTYERCSLVNKRRFVRKCSCTFLLLFRKMAVK